MENKTINTFFIIFIAVLMLFAGCTDKNQETTSTTQTTSTTLQVATNEEPTTVSTAKVARTVPIDTTTYTVPTESILVSGLSDQGFLASYGGYKFRIEDFLYNKDEIRGITFDVMKPDGTFVVAQATKKTPAIIPIENLEISFPPEYARESGGEKTASIYVKKSTEEKPVPSAILLTRVSDGGFLSEYKGYRFKIDHFIHDSDYEVAGALIDVQRPDGTIVQPQASKMANALVDNLEINLPSGYSVDTEDEKTTALYVWESGE